MKHLTYCLISLFIASCGAKEQPLSEGTYRLNGTVTNMDNGELYLISAKNDARVVDTIFVANGVFTFEGSIDNSVQRISIAKEPEARSAETMTGIYIGPARMEMKLDVNDISSVTLTGSKTQSEADKLKEIQEKVTKKYKAQLDAFQANRKLYDSATTEEDKKKYKWIDDDLRTDLAPYNKERDAVLKQFILDHPNSFVSLHNMLFVVGDFTQEKAQSIFANFPKEYKKNPTAKRLEKEIADMSKGIPGAMAGDFDTIDIKGNPIALADFKGQYLLIDFWASWCVPCRKGNPHLLDLYAKYKSKGFEILGVASDDSNPDAWRKAVKDDQIAVWRHVLRGMEVDRSNGGYKVLNDGISGGYNISTLPTKVLVGPDGIIEGRYGGGGEDDAAMDQKLAELFGA